MIASRTAPWVWVCAGCVAGALLGTIAPRAAAENADLAKWEKKLGAPGKVLSTADAEEARRWLEGAQLPADGSSPAEKAQLGRLETHIALALGEAARASEAFARAQAAAPDDKATLRLAWLVAGALGDAQLGAQTLNTLKAQKLAPAAAIDERLQRLELVGNLAPELPNPKLSRQEALGRGQRQALLLHFWSHQGKPSERANAVLQALVGEFAANSEALLIIGFNNDPADQADAARKYADDQHFTWPQAYEPEGETAKRYKIERMPMLVLIDQGGYVRTVGTPGDPEVTYAVRAAVQEALGKQPAVRTKNTSGLVAPEAEVSSGASAPDKETAPPTSEQKPKPSIPEAKALLDKARLYLKTGRKHDAAKVLQELIEKYPDSFEADQARKMGLV